MKINYRIKPGGRCIYNGPRIGGIANSLAAANESVKRYLGHERFKMVETPNDKALRLPPKNL